jgi:hypothetical protein
MKPIKLACYNRNALKNNYSQKDTHLHAKSSKSAIHESCHLNLNKDKTIMHLNRMKWWCLQTAIFLLCHSNYDSLLNPFFTHLFKKLFVIYNCKLLLCHHQLLKTGDTVRNKWGPLDNLNIT